MGGPSVAYVFRIVASARIFQQPGSWNNPDRFWLAVLTLVNWVEMSCCRSMGHCQLVLSVVISRDCWNE